MLAACNLEKPPSQREPSRAFDAQAFLDSSGVGGDCGGVWTRRDHLHAGDACEDVLYIQTGGVKLSKGRVKHAVGSLTGNDDLKAEGQVDETAGRVESAVGQASRKTGDAITRVVEAVKQ
jgi:uncharacterized protein YjbJ (UPF0337 family)